MAVQGDVGGKDEIKTQFSTIEGVYKLLPVPDYNRTNRVAYNNSGGCSSSPLVRVSFICLPDTMVHKLNNHNENNCLGRPVTSVNSVYERTNICYNYGRDLYVYSFKGLRRENDVPKPIEKRSYNKEDIPTCHDFNSSATMSERVSLLVGLMGGQIQLFDPITKEVNKSFNSGERLIDKSKVTCIRWIPDSPSQFLAAHSSGHLYMYNEDLGCALDKPTYQLLKQGEGYSIYTCKSKAARNPLYRWSIGEGSINEFSFSPCCKYLATVSQDGFLRVFNFDTMEIVGTARSYYGGLLCICWSPDGKYIVTGGEDDLITVWSFAEKRVVCRGRGHMSWVTVVAFDPYTTVLADSDSSDEDLSKNIVRNGKTKVNSVSSAGTKSSKRSSLMADGIGLPVTSYRLGTVGQDTLLCLWDLKEDFLKQPYYRPRSSTVLSSSNKCVMNSLSHSVSSRHSSKSNSSKLNSLNADNINHSYTSNSFTAKLANLNFGDKKDKSESKDHKRSLSLSARSSSNCKTSSGKNQVSILSNSLTGSSKVVGTPVCPSLNECPIVEPMVCKKIGLERLTGLVFREDCIVTSCQDGCILTWCRPGGQQLVNQHSASPTPTGVSQNASGGTVV